MTTDQGSRGASRYPGPRPYQDTAIDRRLFFGRDRERAALLHKILAEDVVLLYAKSGTGKTSLLNAGVMEELRRRNFFPLVLRLNNPETEPVGFIQTQLLRRTEGVDLVGGADQPVSLREFFSGLEIWLENERLTPVLVFDQFEELFTTYAQETRAALVAQLNDLVRRRAAGDESIGARPKLVFSLREDYLGEMESVAAAIPQALQNRIRLAPLTPEQAEVAIREPAALESDDLASLRFHYTNAAVARMLDFLSGRKNKGTEGVRDEIEPFALQILCYHLEDAVVRDRKPGRGGVWIRPEDLGTDAQMNGILQRFYERQLQQFDDPKERQKARMLCERGLISDGGYRLSLEKSQIRRKSKMKVATLQQLVDLRLLRAQVWVGGRRYYELSHDSLVEPILAARQERESTLARAQVLLEEQGQAGAAAKELEKVLADGVETAQLLHLYGQTMAARGDYARAIDLYEQALKKSPRNASLHADLGDAYVSDRRVSKRAEAYLRAVDEYRRASSLAPKNVKIYRKLALLHIDEGHFERAFEVFDGALRHHSELGIIFEDLVKALRSRDQDEEARQVCRRALEAKSKSAVFFFNLGYELDELQDYEGALEAWARSFERTDDPATLLNWGVTLGNLERFDEAIDKFERALALDPGYAAAHYNLAETLAEQQQYEKAITHYRKAVEQEPDSVEALRGLARCLERLGRVEEAARELQTVDLIEAETLQESSMNS